jgi:exosortase
MERSTDKNRSIILWMALVTVFTFCYLPAILWLNYKYLTADSYFSHGYLIPFVSAYLIYDRRKQLAGLRPRVWILGLVLITLALLTHIMATLGDINFISGFSMVAYIIGCAMYLFGRQITRAVLFPLLFLFFMCPIPGEILSRAALPMKSMATTVAMVLIDLLNVPCVRSGFTLTMSDTVFYVGAPCNGMRSLISFLALGALLAYIVPGAWWKRVLLLAAIPPLAVGLNGLRIAALLTISHHFGSEAASPESFMHDASGMTVFIIGLAVLMVVTWKMK